MFKVFLMGKSFPLQISNTYKYTSLKNKFLRVGSLIYFFTQTFVVKLIATVTEENLIPINDFSSFNRLLCVRVHFPVLYQSGPRLATLHVKDLDATVVIKMNFASKG